MRRILYGLAAVALPVIVFVVAWFEGGGTAAWPLLLAVTAMPAIVLGEIWFAHRKVHQHADAYAAMVAASVEQHRQHQAAVERLLALAHVREKVVR